MNIFKKFSPTTVNVLKVVGVVIVGFFIIAIISSLFSGFFAHSPFKVRMMGGGPAGGDMRSFNYEAADQYAAEDGVMSGKAMSAPGLSIRNLSPIFPPTPPSGTTGSDAEEYEVTDYNASIETGNVERACGVVADLKGKRYVIFENVNRYDRGCDFTFKVEKDNVPEILAVINELDPENLSENTHTIKRVVDDYTGEIEILERKKKSIDETLENAIDAYDEITILATRSRDAESLAKIIDSKVQLIERLTRERININAELERLARSKAEQLDRLTYTYFHVNVLQNKYFDGKVIKDSWKVALKNFVSNVNKMLQDVTVNLAAYLLFLLQWLVYLFVLIIAAKYAWQFAKYIWKK